jgi:hypothetical protein
MLEGAVAVVGGGKLKASEAKGSLTPGDKKLVDAVRKDSAARSAAAKSKKKGKR